MRAIDYLIKLSPDLKKKTESEIYHMSTALIKTRVRQSLTQDEMARAIGMEVEKLAKLEFADESFGIDEYKFALDRVINVDKK
jgi:DNA-binding transcriptional regulator YiaG